jgi:hypothetical protein
MALIEDLCQRLHYAMGTDGPLPDPLPPGWTHVLTLPSESAAQAVQAELVATGGRDVRTVAADGAWHTYARFPEHAPDQAFEDRRRRLEELAHRHGGEHGGAHR